MPEFEEKYYPFKGGIGKDIHNERIFELPEFPNKLLKTDRAAAQNESYSYDDFLKLRGMLAELETNYGIKTLKPDLVRGVKPGTNKKVVFQLLDKVEGVSLKDEQELEVSSEFAEKAEEYLIKVLNYLEDKFIHKQPYLWDITPIYQVVYGKKQGDTKPEVYFVDTDPEIKTYAGDLKDAVKLYFSDLMDLYKNFVEIVESWTDPEMKFLALKQKLLESLKKISDSPEQLEALEEDKQAFLKFSEDLENTLRK